MDLTYQHSEKLEMFEILNSTKFEARHSNIKNINILLNEYFCQNLRN
jgi:hypothetical protein